MSDAHDELYCMVLWLCSGSGGGSSSSILKVDGVGWESRVISGLKQPAAAKPWH